MKAIISAWIWLSAGSPVDLDATLILQIIIFFLLLFILTLLLYQPFLQILEQRIQRTEGLKEKASKLIEEAIIIEKQYENLLLQARKEAENFTLELKQKTRYDENEMIQNARAQSAIMLSEVKSHIKEMEESIRKEISGKIDEMARLVVNKILNK